MNVKILDPKWKLTTIGKVPCGGYFWLAKYYKNGMPLCPGVQHIKIVHNNEDGYCESILFDGAKIIHEYSKNYPVFIITSQKVRRLI